MMATDPFLHMFQIMSSFNLSPQDIFSGTPAESDLSMSWAKLMQNDSFDIESFKTVLDKAEDIWKRNAEVTPRKPSPTQRADLERINKVAFEQAMSDRFQCVLKASIGRKQHYSATPIKELTNIPLRDMFAPKTHKGRYLICRTILQAVRQLSLQLSVEDPHGQAISVMVTHFPGLFLANSESLEAHFPLGTVMAIREPRMELCDGSGGLTSKECSIKVESPSDIVFLEPSDPILADVTWGTTPSVYRHAFTAGEQWNNLGTKHFRDNHFMPAAIAWSRGLQQNPSMHSLRLNRCQAYIRLNWFSAALADAVYVLSSPECQVDITTKACYRAACAQYGMGYYSEALSQLEALRDKDDDDLKSLITRCRQRMKETTAGEYAWSEMFTAGQATVPHLDVAEFVSPAISVTSSTRRGGRCIRATRDIKPGELLVVAKPFASVFPAEIPSNNRIYAVNFEIARTDGATFVGLINQVVTKLHGSPDESNLIYHLYDGRSLPKLPTTYPPPRASGTHAVTPLIWNADVDITKIVRIISYNAFTPVTVGVATETVEQPSEDEIYTPSAIYTLPSIFNHSCHPNAIWHCFGDVMAIRARETIPEGSEITLSYITGIKADLSQDSYLKAVLQRPCDCVMHTSDRADGEKVIRMRETLFKDISTKLRHQREVAEALLEKLESTYRLPQHVPRLFPFYLRNAIMTVTELDARESHNLELLKLSIKHGFKALKAAGFVMLDTSLDGDEEHRHILPISKDYVGAWTVGQDACILIMIHISASFISLSETTRAERWLRAAWWVHNTAFGGGKALFDLRFGTLLGSMSVPSMDYEWE